MWRELGALPVYRDCEEAVLNAIWRGARAHTRIGIGDCQLESAATVLQLALERDDWKATLDLPNPLRRVN
jgi:hypothetical protein